MLKFQANIGMLCVLTVDPAYGLISPLRGDCNFLSDNEEGIGASSFLSMEEPVPPRVLTPPDTNYSSSMDDPQLKGVATVQTDVDFWNEINDFAQPENPHPEISDDAKHIIAKLVRADDQDKVQQECAAHIHTQAEHHQAIFYLNPCEFDWDWSEAVEQDLTILRNLPDGHPLLAYAGRKIDGISVDGGANFINLNQALDQLKEDARVLAALQAQNRFIRLAGQPTAEEVAQRLELVKGALNMRANIDFLCPENMRFCYNEARSLSLTEPHKAIRITTAEDQKAVRFLQGVAEKLIAIDA